jgi:rare lipoprotein A
MKLRLASLLLVGMLGACSTAPEPVSPPPAALMPDTQVAKHDEGQLIEVGPATWYGPHHQGKKTASGEIFDMNALTAAHRTLPFGTWVLVTNLANGRSVKVRVNDRGPNRPGAVIDLSSKAAEAIGLLHAGIATVSVRRV